MNAVASAVEKLATGIPGFDEIAQGGLPRGRATLLAGTSGSAKTVFAAQFLAEGVKRGESAVFVTHEEPPTDIRPNLLSLGWDIGRWEQEGRWAFVDAVPQPTGTALVSGQYDLGALLARVGDAVRRVSARRLVIDSVGTLFDSLPEAEIVRAELHRVIEALRGLGVTALITAERIEEYGAVSRHGVEEFVSDNVLILRNVLDRGQRHRTLEVVKFRGTDHRKGEHPFTVMPGSGVELLISPRAEAATHGERVPCGDDDLDRMCGGGLFRGTNALVSGAAGCGKTVLAAHFLAAAARAGERALLLNLEEGREQIVRNMQSCGLDFAPMERDGLLRMINVAPESAGLEDHFARLRRAVEEFNPARLALDSLSALERVASPRAFREFVLALAAYTRQRGITALFTVSTSLSGATPVTETHITTIADAIVLLRYVELFGELRRGIAVLKVRGSAHDRSIRELSIDDRGLHIGRAFRNVSGILAGAPRHEAPGEGERMAQMFAESA